jgi:hypothetical protein
VHRPFPDVKCLERAFQKSPEGLGVFALRPRDSHQANSTNGKPGAQNLESCIVQEPGSHLAGPEGVIEERVPDDAGP